MKRPSLVALCAALLLAAVPVSVAPAVPGSEDGGRGMVRKWLRPHTVRDLGEEATVGDRAVTLWRPRGEGAAPLVVFSHGLGGCPTQSSFLTAALAEAGYLVVAPRHADAGCGTPRPDVAPTGPSFSLPRVWSDATGTGRRDDVVVVLAALRLDPAFAGRVDWTRLGLMGHSVGGYTVLGLAGAWPSWRLPGVGAVVALSPSCAPFLQPGGALHEVAVPVLYQSGTHDFGIAPILAGPGGCFDATRGPARLVLFRKAGHFAWTDLQPRVHAGIVAATRDFLDAALRGRSGDSPPARSRDVVALRVK